ncbi:MAG: hypothetical protein U0163_12240 [Gemmatimonadaceae bacterium]
MFELRESATHVLAAAGHSTVRVGTRRVTRQTTVTLEVTDGTRRLLWPRFAVAPVVRRTVYLIPHAHLDIGYTDLQQHVERRHWATYDSALAVIERTRDYLRKASSDGTWKDCGPSNRTSTPRQRPSETASSPLRARAVSR